MEDLVKSPRRFGLLSVAVTMALALALAACGGDDDSDSNASDTTPVPTRRAPSPSPCGSATSRTSPTRPPSSAWSTVTSRCALGDNVTLELSTFNAGPAAVEAIFGGALDASFIGPNPAINAFAQSQRRGHPHRLRRRLGWCVPRHQARDHERRGPGGQDLGHASARQHAGRRAAGMAQGRGLHDRHRRWWRREDRAAGERADPRHASRPVRSTARGCPSRGRRVSSTRAAARSSSTSATCGPRASTSPRTSSSPPSSSTSTPTS